ncbi:flavodoxin short chain [Desulfosalsimonas propionicica]|uniref:Flavodoxin short chain n=1 Tax=Desulfosalsimonas propionicica TaxID=332175 RepID=A0A7W0HMA0_9BACT|nr:flavodoxin domain-containing protein [Desulfosalsimonas propionicica]MBA2883189.1 flavodoxin short chain [Desulfosalsimonas propionicica]
MKKALIIYGTTTGNAEMMAEAMKQEMDAAGLETGLKEVTAASVKDLSAEQDVILLGWPAYGDEEAELQEDFAEFYEKLDGCELNGANFAVFAPGASSYTHFWGSVDMLEAKMESMGGNKVAAGLKIDGDPSDESKVIIGSMMPICARIGWVPWPMPAWKWGKRNSGNTVPNYVKLGTVPGLERQ